MTNSCRRVAAMMALVGIAIIGGAGVSAAAVTMASVSAASAETVTAQPGDSLWTIAARYETSVAELVTMNHLRGNANHLVAGERVTVPTSSDSNGPSYRVTPGDTLTSIARRYGETIEQLATDNGLRVTSPLYAGSILTIRVPATGTTMHPSAASGASARPGSGGVVAAAARTRAELAGRQLPSNATVRSLVVQQARAWGVDPNLALAICLQESGFQQRVVSDSDAIGAMQVLPSNARELSNIAGRPLDLLQAQDNVEAGVLELKVLTREAPIAQAVAAYNQGLSSIQSHGLFSDTKRYVQDVLALRKQFASGKL